MADALSTTLVSPYAPSWMGYQGGSPIILSPGAGGPPVPYVSPHASPTKEKKGGSGHVIAGWRRKVEEAVKEGKEKVDAIVDKKRGMEASLRQRARGVAGRMVRVSIAGTGGGFLGYIRGRFPRYAQMGPLDIPLEGALAIATGTGLIIMAATSKKTDDWGLDTMEGIASGATTATFYFSGMKLGARGLAKANEKEASK